MSRTADPGRVSRAERQDRLNSRVFSRTSCLILIVLQLGAAATAATPYGGIAASNVFRLDPMVLPQTAIEKPKARVSVKLAGFTTIVGKRALLIAEIPARPPDPARQESYILAEGQCGGDIEVLAIDEKAGTVEIRNGGIRETLDFLRNGVKLASAGFSPGASSPGLVHVPPNPGATPGAQVRVQVPVRPLTPEEQIIMIEAERVRTREEVFSGSMPPLPPTELTPEDQAD